jgi:hypothetical protein
VEADWTRPEPSPWPARLLALAVALVVTAPTLAPGLVLLRDMVFVPRQDLDLDAPGLGSGLPRAVPVDSVMALVTAVLPGDLVQKALLLAFAALPWIARAALRVRAGEPGALPRLVLACAPAALTPTGSLLAAGVAVVLAGRRRALLTGGTVLVLSLPWTVAGVLHPAGGVSDPAGVAAFAARAEGPGGPLLALLGTGGIWNAWVEPRVRPAAGGVVAPGRPGRGRLGQPRWRPGPARRREGKGVLGPAGRSTVQRGRSGHRGLPVGRESRESLEELVTDR